MGSLDVLGHSLGSWYSHSGLQPPIGTHIVKNIQANTHAYELNLNGGRGEGKITVKVSFGKVSSHTDLF